MECGGPCWRRLKDCRRPEAGSRGAQHISWRSKLHDNQCCLEAKPNVSGSRVAGTNSLDSALQSSPVERAALKVKYR